MKTQPCVEVWGQDAGTPCTGSSRHKHAYCTPCVACLQRQAVDVYMLHCLLHVLHTDEGQHGAKGLHGGRRAEGGESRQASKGLGERCEGRAGQARRSPRFDGEDTLTVPEFTQTTLPTHPSTL